jgi:hypothetical protein
MRPLHELEAALAAEDRFEPRRPPWWAALPGVIILFVVAAFAVNIIAAFLFGS